MAQLSSSIINGKLAISTADGTSYQMKAQPSTVNGKSIEPLLSSLNIKDMTSSDLLVSSKQVVDYIAYLVQNT